LPRLGTKLEEADVNSLKLKISNYYESFYLAAIKNGKIVFQQFLNPMKPLVLLAVKIRQNLPGYMKG